jgi:hypothetical protein
MIINGDKYIHNILYDDGIKKELILTEKEEKIYQQRYQKIKIKNINYKQIDDFKVTENTENIEHEKKYKLRVFYKNGNLLTQNINDYEYNLFFKYLKKYINI